MTWDRWERAADRGPEALLWKGGCLLAVVIVLGALVGFAFRMVGGAATVVEKEFGAEASLRKYEWFKDVAARMDAQQANINQYGKRMGALQKAYGGEPRSKWSREDREQANLWEQEVAGLKASYNGLSSEYNSAMSRENWRWANAGQVPAGGRPLPREYRPYLED